MRCLYCGKELALLKRWTSGGEFCSDTHRQQYQEEYNQLALNRLLQAKPQATKSPEPKQPDPAPAAPAADPPKAAPAAPARSTRQAAPATSSPEAPRPRVRHIEIPAGKPAAQSQAEPEPVASVLAVEPAAEELAAEEPDPAELAGFTVEVPVPAMEGGAARAAAETAFERSLAPALPERNLEEWRTQLVAAGQVVFQPSRRVLDCAGRPGERRLEVREFVRTAPVVEFDLHAAGAGGLPEISEEPMDILIFPHPPKESPPLWQEGEKTFVQGIELGVFTRVVFRTTGLHDDEEGLDPMPAEAAPEPVHAAAREPEVRKPAVEPPPPPKTPAAHAPAAPKPSFLRPLFSKPAEKTAPAPVPAPAPRKPADPVPDLITKPLPLTLDGLAAGRGKAVQIFPSAVSSGLDIQAPRSTALPLRPAMTLGPVPAAAKTPDRKTPVALKTDAKLDVRSRKPEARAPEPVKPAAELKPAAAAAVKAPPAPPVEPKKPAPARPASTPPASNQPASNPPASNQLSRPYATPDLGLPTLHLTTSSGFWSSLPIAGKLGVAALVLVALAGGVFMITRGGTGISASTAPQVVADYSRAAPDPGWIANWGAETGVRREHDISVWRPSISLSDYRLEFQAQIESKALGWVYRAMDGKNYYVSKLEIVKPGLEPAVALVHFAVVNGEAQPRSQFPLPMPVRIDTVYKVRFDAVGDRFTTWVQDQKVDDFTDDRIKTGGVGLYNDRDERMSLIGSVRVVPLVIRK